jgi:hypothetical protein
MKKPENTESMKRELGLVEDALGSGRITAVADPERELQELALALQAEAPEPDPAFGADLLRRLREGFRDPTAGPGWRRLAGLRRLPRARTLAFAGGGASLLVAAVVAVSLQDSGGPSGQAVSAPGVETPKQGAEPLSREAAPGVGGDFRPGEPERRIERSASLTLAAPEDELEHVAEGITAVADRHGGFVLRSSLTTGDEGASGGSFELRVPAGRLQPALHDLAALASVRSRTQSGQDVTPELVTARDRLQAARAERHSLLRRLERAGSDAEAEAIRRRLDLVAGEIRSLRARLRDLRLRTDYAVVSVLLERTDHREGAGALGDPDDALGDALGSLATAAGLAVRAVGVVIPLGLVACVAWLVARAFRRRRRETALA